MGEKKSELDSPFRVDLDSESSETSDSQNSKLAIDRLVDLPVKDIKTAIMKMKRSPMAQV